MKNQILIVFIFVTGVAFHLKAQDPVLSVTITTEKESASSFLNKTIFAAWIENVNGEFIKTLALYSQNKKHRKHLSAFMSKTPNANTVDAITGATLAGANYTNTVLPVWNGKDTIGNVMPKGKYVLKCEQSSHNGAGPLSIDTIDIMQPKSGDFPYVAGFSSRKYEIWSKDTGLKNQSIEKQNLRIYQNPVGSRCFTVESKDWINDKRIEIYNLSGDWVLTFPITGEQTFIDTSVLLSGTYILKCVGSRFIKSKKIIVL